MTAPTLKEVLHDLGYELRPRADSRHQGKALYRAGSFVWAGSAGECWAWLRETGQLEKGPCSDSATG